jgi:uncharacterized protein (DUF433 family)
MGAIQKSLRIPQKTVEEIERLARETGQAFSAITKDLLAEAIKMRRCPGIVFTDGLTGRKARIAGTGLEVWEVITTYMGVKRNFNRLQKAYHWLTEQQLRAAIGYYIMYREEVDQQIEQNESWSKEKIIEYYPHLNSA